MDVILHIWLRLLERYAEQVFFQGESSGVVSFLLIGVLVYLYKQEKRANKKQCPCTNKSDQKENKYLDKKEEAE
ncbi:hypothetical protein [Sutcliffiella rhizosphaerae]|uniref:FeoB-associated Cys-rich membrane protein n=1 Tax=Sutcliffiella rhizosphaerae TaxID=2880967 RepID=A0ABM8YLL0_9BACI|nr:hypothetical protein [Sutcliffiella rhizosphaerae]CAG9620629.1 hypothetical protein BACCIP111883_01398 [Sutcliffiella rhizosphaerae]